MVLTHDFSQVIYKQCNNIITGLEHLPEGEFPRETESDAGSFLILFDSSRLNLWIFGI